MLRGTRQFFALMLATVSTPAMAQQGPAPADLFKQACIAPILAGQQPESAIERDQNWSTVEVPDEHFAKEGLLSSQRTWRRSDSRQPIYVTILRMNSRSAQSLCELRAPGDSSIDGAVRELVDRGFLPELPASVRRGVPTQSDRRVAPSYRFAARSASGRHYHVEFQTSTAGTFLDLPTPAFWAMSF